MIFYFSATGNSYHVAKQLSVQLKEKMVNIATAQKQDCYTLQPNEKLGFIFSVHAWGVPEIVETFVKNLKLYFTGELYVYGVCTCGQSAGKAIDFLDKALRTNGLKLNSGYSIIMPDNYAVLFRAPSKETSEKILNESEQTLYLITRAIQTERKNFFRVHKGIVSNALSYGVHPLFRKFGTTTKPFRVEDTCISCGKCETICPTKCIQIQQEKPVWNHKHCSMCMACLQRCPMQAIQYGKFTKQNGRYVHPDYDYNSQ